MAIVSSLRSACTWAAILLVSLASPALCRFPCEPLRQPQEGLTVRYFATDAMHNMRLAASDAGSGARTGLSVFRPINGYWFGQTPVDSYNDLRSSTGCFFGPGYNVTYDGDITATNSPIKAPVTWNRVWSLRTCIRGPSWPWGSISGYVYGIFCPQPPPGYVALGCIFRKSSCSWSARMADFTPSLSDPDVLNFVTLRKDLAAPAYSSGIVWNDGGSGARDDVTTHVLHANRDSGCGFELHMMFAQAGFHDYGDATNFAVPDFSKVYFQAGGDDW